MTWDIRPGMRVVCVDDQWPPVVLAHAALFGSVFPTKGRVYTVREALMWAETVCLRLVEIHNPDVTFFDDAGNPVEPAFKAARFRPLDEARLDVFRNLLVDLPQEEELA